jgi:hypothetical protein
MDIVCLDMEGVLVPEIWIEFAEKNGYRGAESDHEGHPGL